MSIPLRQPQTQPIPVDAALLGINNHAAALSQDTPQDAIVIKSPEMLRSDNHWMEVWKTPDYAKIKMANVEQVLTHMAKPPRRILDIGCGPAFESQEFNRRFGTELWLLDGDFSTTNTRMRDTNFGEVKEFKFYSRLADLRRWFHQQGLVTYTLVDANNISIPSDVKFDLIYSFLSCGFHYPVTTYRDLILQHSNANTRLIFELRDGVDHGVEILQVLGSYRKSRICEIKF